MTTLSHPKKNVIPMAAGLAWGNDGAIYQEKLDGEFATLELPLVGLLAGERLRGGEFICFDVLDWQGRDLTGLALNTRISFRNSLCRAAGISIVPEAQHGGEFLARVLARGGEGVVRKLPGDTYFTPMIACKRVQTWPCAVTGFVRGSQSVTIADPATGQDRGRLTLRGGKCDQVRPGSLVKVEGMNLTPTGKIREPRVCQDTPTSWLIRF